MKNLILILTNLILVDSFSVEVLGNKSIAVWLASFTFVLIGVIVSLRLSSLKRNKDSPNTPIKFSLLFLIRDNILRGLGSLFVAFSVIRFSEELLQIQFTYFFCFTLGACFDQALIFVHKWQKAARDNFKQEK